MSGPSCQHTPRAACRHGGPMLKPWKGLIMGNSFKVATVGGIEIRIDWTWLVAFAFFTWSIGAYYDNTFHSWGSGKAYLIGAASTILLFVTVLLHELGHSFTARSLGLPVNTITLFIF